MVDEARVHPRRTFGDRGSAREEMLEVQVKIFSQEIGAGMGIRLGFLYTLGVC